MQNIISYIKKAPKKILILIFLSIFVLLFYFFSDKSYLIKVNQEDGIRLGREVAGCLSGVYGSDSCLEWDQYLLDKRKNNTFISLDIIAQKQLNLKEKDIIFDMYVPKNIDDDFKLVMLKDIDSRLVMTFGLQNSGKILEIPDKGHLLFTVAVGYFRNSKKWEVKDYYYNYQLNDYFDYFEKKGVPYTEANDEENKKLIEAFAKGEKTLDEVRIIRSVIDSIWLYGSTETFSGIASTTTAKMNELDDIGELKGQIKDIEKLYKMDDAILDYLKS